MNLYYHFVYRKESSASHQKRYSVQKRKQIIFGLEIILKWARKSPCDAHHIHSRKLPPNSSYKKEIFTYARISIMTTKTDDAPMKEQQNSHQRRLSQDDMFKRRSPKDSSGNNNKVPFRSCIFLRHLALGVKSRVQVTPIGKYNENPAAQAPNDMFFFL